jgi:hypothetical protein
MGTASKFPKRLLDSITAVQESATLMQVQLRTLHREVASEDESDAQDSAMTYLTDARRFARWIEGSCEEAVKAMDNHNGRGMLNQEES